MVASIRTVYICIIESWSIDGREGEDSKYGNNSKHSIFCVFHTIELALTFRGPMNDWSPECPVLKSSAQLLQTHAKGFFYEAVISYLIFLFSFAFYFFCPELICLAKNPAFCFDIFSSSDVSALICSRTPLFIFLMVYSIHRTLLQHHISIESILSLSAFSTVQFSHPYIVIGNTKIWIILPLVFNLYSWWPFLILPLLSFWVSAFSWFLGFNLHLNWWLNQGKHNI